MKNHIFKTELRRALCGTGMKLALFVGLVIVVMEFVMVTLPAATTNTYDLYPDEDWGVPHQLWANWLGGDMLISLPVYLYRLLLPLLAALPFASSYAADVNSGYLRHLVIRTDKRRYLLAKLLAVWTSGGIATVFPLAASFMAATAVLPFRGPPRTANFIIGSNQLFGELYANTPLLYFLLASAVVFAFCGAMALIGTFLSLYVHQPFLLTVAPFTVYLGADIVARRLDPLNADRFLPMQFLHPNQWMEGHPEIVFGEMALLLLLFGGGFYLIAARRDTL